VAGRRVKDTQYTAGELLIYKQYNGKGGRFQRVYDVITCACAYKEKGGRFQRVYDVITCACAYKEKGGRFQRVYDTITPHVGMCVCVCVRTHTRRKTVGFSMHALQ
jgi:hypothetical protein